MGKLIPSAKPGMMSASKDAGLRNLGRPQNKQASMLTRKLAMGGLGAPSMPAPGPPGLPPMGPVKRFGMKRMWSGGLPNTPNNPAATQDWSNLSATAPAEIWNLPKPQSNDEPTLPDDPAETKSMSPTVQKAAGLSNSSLGALGALGSIAGTAINSFDPKNAYGVQSQTGATASGALSGAGEGMKMGAQFGPAGAAIGAGLGAITGGLFSARANAKAMGMQQSAIHSQEVGVEKGFTDQSNARLAGNLNKVTGNSVQSFNRNGGLLKQYGKGGSMGSVQDDQNYLQQNNYRRQDILENNGMLGQIVAPGTDFDMRVAAHTHIDRNVEDVEDRNPSFKDSKSAIKEYGDHNYSPKQAAMGGLFKPNSNTEYAKGGLIHKHGKHKGPSPVQMQQIMQQMAQQQGPPPGGQPPQGMPPQGMPPGMAPPGGGMPMPPQRMGGMLKKYADGGITGGGGKKPFPLPGGSPANVIDNMVSNFGQNQAELAKYQSNKSYSDYLMAHKGKGPASGASSEDEDYQAYKRSKDPMAGLYDPYKRAKGESIGYDKVSPYTPLPAASSDQAPFRMSTQASLKAPASSAKSGAKSPMYRPTDENPANVIHRVANSLVNTENDFDNYRLNQRYSDANIISHDRNNTGGQRSLSSEGFSPIEDQRTIFANREDPMAELEPIDTTTAADKLAYRYRQVSPFQDLPAASSAEPVYQMKGNPTPKKAMGGLLRKYADGGEISNDTDQDPGDKYRTKLSPKEEAGYASWRSKLPKPLQWDGDYDLKGLYHSNPNQSPSANLHFPDTYKLPNHPTFSDESNYYNPSTKSQAGHWSYTDSSSVYTPFDPKIKHRVEEMNEKAMGGLLKKYAAGGNVTSPGNMANQPAQGGNLAPMSKNTAMVQGPSHENGGVGVPGMNAEVEGGETTSGNFVFSKDLGFADKHAPIARALGAAEKKPSSLANDNTIKILKGKEDALKQKQEATKQQMNIPNDSQSVGAPQGAPAPDPNQPPAPAQPDPSQPPQGARNGGILKRYAEGGLAGDPDGDKKKKAAANLTASGIPMSASPSPFVGTKTQEFDRWGARAAAAPTAIDQQNMLLQQTRSQRPADIRGMGINAMQIDPNSQTEDNFLRSNGGVPIQQRQPQGVNNWQNTPVMQNPKGEWVADPNPRHMAKGGMMHHHTKPKGPSPGQMQQMMQQMAPQGGPPQGMPPGVPQGMPPGAPMPPQRMGGVLKKYAAGGTTDDYPLPDPNSGYTQGFNPLAGIKGIPGQGSSLVPQVPASVSGQTSYTAPGNAPATLLSRGQKFLDTGVSGLAAAGKLATSATPYMADIYNMNRQLPSAPTYQEQSLVQPSLVDFSASRQNAQAQGRAASVAANKTLGSGAEIAAVTAANAAGTTEGINKVNEAEGNANAQIKNQASTTNSYINARNVAGRNKTADDQVSRINAQQGLMSSSLAQMGNKTQELQKLANDRSAEVNKYLITLGTDINGVSERNHGFLVDRLVRQGGMTREEGETAHRQGKINDARAAIQTKQMLALWEAKQAELGEAGKGAGSPNAFNVLGGKSVSTSYDSNSNDTRTKTTIK